MAKFVEMRDLFKWNKQLMEDDWNDGQAYVVKATTKSGDAEFTNTAKVGEVKGDAHKVALEHKTKWVSKDLKGEMEFKAKNSGEMVCDTKLDFIKDYEGFEPFRLLFKGAYNKNQTPLNIGFSYMNDSVKFDSLQEISKDYGLTMNMTVRYCNMILGGTKTWKSVTKPLNDVTWGCGVTGHFEKTLHWGLGVNGSSPTIEATTVKDATLYFHQDTEKQTVGAQMKYNVPKKAFDCKVGLALKQGDHTWKLRLHDSGLARAALQWQLHKVCKATVDTSVDLKQALNGSITSVPLGFTFDVKY